MKYHYMNDNNEVLGPVELEQISNMPRDTLVRAVGETRWRPMYAACKMETSPAQPPSRMAAKGHHGGPYPPTLQEYAAQANDEGNNESEFKFPLMPILLMLLGIFAGGLSIAVGIPLLTYAIVLCFWAGLCAAIALGADMRANTGYLAGAFLGPLGILLMIVLVIVRSSRAPKNVSA